MRAPCAWGCWSQSRRPWLAQRARPLRAGARCLVANTRLPSARGAQGSKGSDVGRRRRWRWAAGRTAGQIYSVVGGKRERKRRARTRPCDQRAHKSQRRRPGDGSGWGRRPCAAGNPRLSPAEGLGPGAVPLITRRPPEMKTLRCAIAEWTRGRGCVLYVSCARQTSRVKAPDRWARSRGQARLLRSSLGGPRGCSRGRSRRAARVGASSRARNRWRGGCRHAHPSACTPPWTHARSTTCARSGGRVVPHLPRSHRSRMFPRRIGVSMCERFSRARG
jgi:hypothetical protein